MPQPRTATSATSANGRGQVGPNHERDEERRVHDEYEGTAAVQHGMLDCAVLGPLHSRRGAGCAAPGEPRGRRVARSCHRPRISTTRATTARAEQRYAGHDFGPERQPARDVMHPGLVETSLASSVLPSGRARIEPTTSATTASESTAKIKSAGRPYPAAWRPSPALPGARRARTVIDEFRPESAAGRGSRSCRERPGAGLFKPDRRHGIGLPAVTPGIHLGALRSKDLAASRDHACPAANGGSLRPSPRMLRPSIFRLVLILRHADRDYLLWLATSSARRRLREIERS